MVIGGGVVRAGREDCRGVVTLVAGVAAAAVVAAVEGDAFALSDHV